MKKSQVKFSVAKTGKAIFKSLVPVQTERLIAYAKETMTQIGNTIQTYHSINHMDRTGNLLNSLCWGVSYRGKLEGFGFYREASSLRQSYLHEWDSRADAFPVDGHRMAQNYIDKYGKTFTTGWRVFFAILAPYWGYWETGFTFKGVHGERFMQFAVMTQFYDTIQKELEPANVTFHVTKDIKYSQNELDKYNESGRYSKWKSRSKYADKTWGWKRHR